MYRNDGFACARRALDECGCVSVTSFISPEVVNTVAVEAVRLADTIAVRRDLTLAETDSTPRRMWNATRARIAEYGTVIPSAYRSSAVIDAVSRIAGEQVFACPYEPEQFVITRLERPEDTHGWHWDDYSFALVWVAECPPVVDGGFVECVPHTVWDKHRPDVDGILRDRAVHRLEVGAGEVYLMRTKTTLHRVHPIRRGRRTIVNMAFAAAGELCAEVSHETMDALWSTAGTE
ncbi:HalD/BesD family halogenase [Nocardia thraciensis]